MVVQNDTIYIIEWMTCIISSRALLKELLGSVVDNDIISRRPRPIIIMTEGRDYSYGR